MEKQLGRKSREDRGAGFVGWMEPEVGGPSLPRLCARLRDLDLTLKAVGSHGGF